MPRPARESPLSDLLRTLERIFSEPLAVEALFAGVALVALWFLVRALRAVAGRVSRRRALKEFVGGVDAYFKGEFAQARDLLAKVIERDPENSEARILLGDAARELGDPAEAHKHHYQVASVFGLDLPRNRLSLGTDLLDMGRAREAVEHLEKAVEAYPEDRTAAERLLRAELETGRLAEAVQTARRLLDGDSGPGSGRRLARLLAEAGREHLERGEVREGTGLLKAALKAYPALVGPRLDLVRSVYLHGSTRAAEKELGVQLREMTRLAEEGPAVFEPPRPAKARSEAPAPAPGGPGEAPRLPAPARPGLPAPEAAGQEGTENLDPEDAAGTSLATAGRGCAPARGGRGDLPEVALPMEVGELVRRLLPREAVYLCSRCGAGTLSFVESCPECAGFGTLVAADGTALAPVPDMAGAVNEILENRAFLRGLVRKAAAGDEAAAIRLAGAGPRAIPGIFRELLRVSDAGPLLRVLSSFGPTAVPELIEAWRRAGAFSTRRLVREGVRAFRSGEGLLVRVLAGMGPEVTAALDPLVESGERDLRLVALDVLIRLGDAERVEALRLEYSTKEVLDRLSACPPPELGPFLDRCPDGGFLMEQVLVDRTFPAEEALADALARPGNRTKMRKVLMGRGFSSRVYERLEECWEQEGLRVVIRDVIRSFGRDAADHLIHTCTTGSVSEAVREEAIHLLVDLGGVEVDRITERLLDGDRESEAGLLRLILAFGQRAVPAIVRAYGKTGFFEKVGLNRRRVLHRKTLLIRTLGRIGGHEARQALRQVRERENDPDLRRRIEALLARREEPEEGS